MAARRNDDAYNDGRSRREEVAYVRLVRELHAMNRWWEDARRRPGVIPADGAGIAASAPGGRSKLTLKLDVELVKWFRAMGLGYQARINHTLRAWMVSVVNRETDPREAWRKERL